MKMISALILNIIMLSFLISGAYAGDPKGLIIHRTINIIGAEVKDLQGELFGKIIKLERHDDTRDITFAVIALRSEPGTGEKVITVPISVLRFTNDNDALIDLTKEELALIPGFEGGKKVLFQATN